MNETKSMIESAKSDANQLFSDERLFLSAYDYELPSELIAQSPTINREDARLMVIERKTKTIRHLLIHDFPSLLTPDDAIVLNNTKVLPARLIGFRTETQGNWEGLFLRFLFNGDWEIMSKTRGKLRNNETITLKLPEVDSKPLLSNANAFSNRSKQPSFDYLLKIIERTEAKTLIVRPVFQNNHLPNREDVPFENVATCSNIDDSFAYSNEQSHFHQEKTNNKKTNFFLHSEQIERSMAFLEKVGWVPIPPYIRAGRMTSADRNDYQTVFAQEPGAVAAPTAGLHFSQKMLDTIRDLGVAICPLTLHVGAGTFKPISVDRLSDHKMHSEFASISQEIVDILKQRRQNGGRIIAIGTTSVRTLESASNCDSNGNIDSSGQNDSSLSSFQGYTDLFIRPPYRFKSVDAMLTNFHLPKSTLLVLVRTFGGNELLKKAYQEAIEHKYRFYSYGDAMIIF